MTGLTKVQQFVLDHALGVSDGEKKSTRNFFSSPSDGVSYEACVELHGMGLLKVVPGTGGLGFVVTAAGKCRVDHEIPIAMVYKNGHPFRIMHDASLRQFVLDHVVTAPIGQKWTIERGYIRWADFIRQPNHETF